MHSRSSSPSKLVDVLPGQVSRLHVVGLLAQEEAMCVSLPQHTLPGTHPATPRGEADQAVPVPLRSQASPDLSASAASSTSKLGHDSAGGSSSWSSSRNSSSSRAEPFEEHKSSSLFLNKKSASQNAPPPRSSLDPERVRPATSGPRPTSGTRREDRVHVRGSSTRSGGSHGTSSTCSSNSPPHFGKSLGARQQMEEMTVEDVDFDEDESLVPSHRGRGAGGLVLNRPMAEPGGAPRGALAQAATSARGRPISVQEATDLRRLVFRRGAALGKFGSAWSQGFFFKGAATTRAVPTLAFGLVQRDGGPCGILAAVQAFILKELLFNGGSSRNQRSVMCPPASTREGALVSALTEITWKCGEGRRAVGVTYGKSTARGGGYSPDGCTEKLDVFEFRSREDLRAFFQANLATYMAEDKWGVVLLVYCVILSRGIANIGRDKDYDDATLIGAHGYCTQELVNLCLVGRACSNVFDGVKNFDQTVLKGVEEQGDVGFLTLFEHYNNLVVGEHLKSPKVPIWVLQSESHYTVLFCLDRNGTTSSKFDLYYYDELANQEEEIRLTIDTSRRTAPKKDPTLEPPINECVRTKWGSNAWVDWNGVDPIL